MKTAASLFAAVLAFAGLSTSAGAKEDMKIASARVCGPSDCVAVTDRPKANALTGSRTPGTPPPVSSFYTVELAIGSEGKVRSTFYYVPSAAMSRPAYKPGQAGPSPRVWTTVTPHAAAVFREVARGLKPFPKPHLSSVRIGSRTVIDGADSYLRLFDLPSTSRAAGRLLAYSEPIDFRSTQPTPWTDGSSDLSFSPSAGLLARGGHAVRIPEELLADLRGRTLGTNDGAARPVGTDDDSGSVAWPAFIAALAAVLFATVVVVALLLRRGGTSFPRTPRFRFARARR